MKRANACTKPKGEMLESIKANTDKLFESFRTDFLSAQTEIPNVTLRVQKSRSKLSQEAATKICKIAKVKRAGFNRKMLRPDIDFWFDKK